MFKQFQKQRTIITTNPTTTIISKSQIKNLQDKSYIINGIDTEGRNQKLEICDKSLDQKLVQTSLSRVET